MTARELVRNGLIAAFVAVLVGGAGRVLGLDAPHALAVGGGVLALVLVLLAQRSVVPPADTAPADPDPPVGGRRDVEQLAWSMVEHGTRVRQVVLDRVTAIAVERLADHGLDPRREADGAAIATLLGQGPWAVLRPDRRRPVQPRALAETLRALERLRPAGADRTTSNDRTRRAD